MMNTPVRRSGKRTVTQARNALQESESCGVAAKRTATSHNIPAAEVEVEAASAPTTAAPTIATLASSVHPSAAQQQTLLELQVVHALSQNVDVLVRKMRLAALHLRLAHPIYAPGVLEQRLPLLLRRCSVVVPGLLQEQQADDGELGNVIRILTWIRSLLHVAGQVERLSLSMRRRQMC